ncbi:MAG: flagellar hook-associated protein FlgL [Novosphingobium sp.]|nr:flagellar hook-associated protein FlgL [Novosphingobium sp.]
MTLISNSTSAFYDRSSLGIGDLRRQAEDLQAQIGSQQKLSRSSDNPVVASRLRTLARSDSLAQIDTTNANRASSDLNLTDQALTSFTGYIQRVQEIAIASGNGTLTASQRSAYGTELAGIQTSMVALANSRDSAGHSLFGGDMAGQPYSVDASGNAVYSGTASAGQISLGEGQTVSRGLTGPEFLNFTAAGGPTDLMAVVKGLGDALQGGVADPAAYARDSLTTLSTGLDKLTTAQTVVGSRLSWIDQTTQHSTNLSELRSAEQTNIGATDIPSTMVKLTETMTALEASQASFTKLAALSLFDMMR